MMRLQFLVGVLILALLAAAAVWVALEYIPR